MKIALIGGTGYVGHYIVKRLIESDLKPIVLARQGSENKLPESSNIQFIAGDINNEDAINDLMKEADVVIYLIGILREFASQGITFNKLQYQGAKKAIDVAVNAKISRFILMSANGVKKEGTAYQQSKFLAEEYLKASGLNWTIFRPSVIFGDPQGKMEFATQLRKEIIDMPLPAPLFFEQLDFKQAGQFELAPAHVSDVAEAFVKSVSSNDCINKTYSLCGPKNMSWKDILKTIAETVGKNKLMLPAPTWGVKSAALFFDRFEFFPISRDQITMLMEGNTCGSNDEINDGINNGFKELGIIPQEFNTKSLSYLN